MSSTAPDAPAAPSSQAVQSAIRTILVHVQAGLSAAPRLRTAVALAGRLEATLFGLAAETIPPLGAMDPTGLMEGAWYVEMREQVQRNLELARETFREAAKGLRTDFAWIEDMPAQAIARAARSADLILAGGQPLSEGDRYRNCDAAEVMLRAGRPVLVAPPEGGDLAATAVIVAWKDSRESRRALADALPFLTRAESVHVVEVCAAQDDVADAQRRARVVVAGLERHDVKAHARAVVAPPERVAAELNIAAEAIGADLIVAGGYGHTRFGEWVFGGVTRDLLRQPDRFVLLSH
jgi:nucleotide-binding universal stress UspA family protein